VDREAKTEVKTQSSRSDGTHPIHGKIHLETSPKDFQCSFDSSNTLADFQTEGRSWAAFVRHGKSPCDKNNSPSGPRSRHEDDTRGKSV
jgi:hypothetical protein